MHIKVAIRQPDELVCSLRLFISGIGDISAYGSHCVPTVQFLYRYTCWILATFSRRQEVNSKYVTN